VTVGRPRAFDVDVALDRALDVFWRKGYEGASMAELTDAMGINRPSLYAAFGNKEELFRKVLDRYLAGPAGFACAALEAPTAREVAERLLFGAVDALTDPEHPRGCLVVLGALSCGTTAEPIREELVLRRAAAEAALRDRFFLARENGDLPGTSDPGDLARYIWALLHGMTVHAASGATRGDLRCLAEMVIRSWPPA